MNQNNRLLGWTTLEESQQLIKAGLSVETADMCYPHFIKGGADSYDANPMPCSSLDYPYEMPCWSLGALLELIPDEITYSDFKPFKLRIFKDDECHYFIQYYPLYEGGVFCEATGHTLVEASINMILYLLNNGFIKYEQEKC